MAKKEEKTVVAYELIKLYPGSHSIGTIVSYLKIPGHQWPEYWRPVYNVEFRLRERKNDLLNHIKEIDDQLKAFKQ